MDITWFGQSFFRIKGKSASLVIDPFDPDFLGLKFPKDVDADVVLSTHGHKDHNNTQAIGGTPLIISGPGEYEKAGISVEGISSFHDDAEGAERGKNTVYHILMDGINIVHLGDLGHLLTDEQTSQIDAADILMVPVGGKYALDAEKAAKVAAQLEPRIIIPMHYKLSLLSGDGEIPGSTKDELDDVEPFLKEMGAESAAPLPKLSVTKDKLPDEPMVVLLSKS